ncbi:unnamed protein product [Rhizophagus irregularis]|nr:unnamed protein product [Rhizophagus irregularis]
MTENTTIRYEQAHYKTIKLKYFCFNDRVALGANKARLDKYWKTKEKASSTSEGVYSVNEEVFFDEEVLSINEEAY